MNQIRNQDVKNVGIMLVANLRRMAEKLDAIRDFELNRFTVRYMLHMLARFTDYVNLQMGLAPQFGIYVDRNPKTSYDIEHILPDDYATYAEYFNDEEDFNAYRQKIGNLILLTSDHNRSYQSMPYDEKVMHYPNDNIMAQSLNRTTYKNNPKFLRLKDQYGFKPYPIFDKTAIRERAQLYLALAKGIWNPAAIKDIAGGWDDDTELAVTSGTGKRFTVEYGDGRSWPDAVKWGFVSAGGNGSKLSNINIGDMVLCHIAGVGFVGVGVCSGKAVPMSDFYVSNNGEQKCIIDCDWNDKAAKDALDINSEYMLAVKWLRTVSVDFGYWEKGMKSIPSIAYEMNDTTTHDMVLKHFNITAQ